ncbi:RNA polymerase sigma factor [Mucilaginibacter arboris]|uniref:Sigma-70 family RNA polymerase sigma factor n=1 Tax=Mucilaginibacter arboris TaxID=2682090 RepID=A0A7K1SS36_9SPHI|nr:sigma-70 family RNA polymerase sigma factor [Mucilaginibacter arboris]MVN20121.1 sigma-70 family RNA polymerase sigma factor [Mucilaginibacter arboris]
MQKELSDIELIKQVLAGHQSAYADLVKRHQRYVFTLAIRFVKNRENAEEVAQDCFVKAYKALGSFQQQSKFSTWLYTIVYTTSMTFLRKKKLNTYSIDDDAVFMEVKNQTEFKTDQTEQKSQTFYINLAISKLLPDDAAIMTLFYQGEQSLEEIAAVMEMETNTVKVKLHRARHRLKEKLESLLKEEVRELL